MQEIWRTINGFGGYEVSSFGRVRSYRPINRFATAPQEARIITPFTKGKRKYLHCSLRNGGELRSAKVHHLVLETFVGPKPDGMQGCHLDDSKGNNRLDNLYWGTQAQNVADKMRNGKQVQGSKNHFATISEQTALEIKDALALDKSRGCIERISQSMNVSRHIISKIKNNNTWRHV